MQQRGVQVVEIADIFYGMDTKFIRRSVRGSAPDAPAGDEDRKAFRMMIATVWSRSMWCPPKLASP